MAKAGLPMKARRIGSTLSFFKLLALLLGKAAHDHVAPERRQVINKQDPIEMVDLVLKAGRQQAIRIDLLPRPCFVLIADLDPRPAELCRRTARAGKGSLPPAWQVPRFSGLSQDLLGCAEGFFHLA